MGDVIRFGVSLDNELLEKFDEYVRERNYTARSEAIRDLIRDVLVKQEWTAGKETAGSITLVYDHHRRDLVTKLMEIQHDFHDLIISSQHVHLDHDNCLEIIVVKGSPKDVQALAYRLKAEKGVKHSSLSVATTGKDLK